MTTPSAREIFLKENPQAVWVTTVAECLARLDQPWDEVHLDHDLGGKTFVDSTDQDCGMEVIRWLCKEPRTHLKDSRFFVHTHHAAAGLLMVLQMRGYGYKAEFRPFGLDLARLLAHNEPLSRLRSSFQCSVFSVKTMNSLNTELKTKRAKRSPKRSSRRRGPDRPDRRSRPGRG